MNERSAMANNPVALRHRAEKKLAVHPPKISGPALDAQHQLHELQVHQIELEMQNEELRATQSQVEILLARFTDLYDFAPVGYFTLTLAGIITQSNLTGARLLGLERARLPGQRLLSFFAQPDRVVLRGFLQHAFTGRPDSFCEIIVQGKDRPPRTVRIEATLSTDGTECRAMAMDVTERKRADEENRRLYAELEERVRQRTATIRKLATELTLAEQRERLRLSHVLHEDLQQLIIGAIYILQPVRTHLLPKEQKIITAVKQILTETIQVARTLAVELSPPVLRDEGLASVLRWLGRWMQENHGLKVKVTINKPELALPQELAVILYQAVRELLFNVVKHARIKAATVTMGCLEGQVRIVVSDRGAGFIPEPASRLESSPQKFGLFSVRERLALLDGQMDIVSAPHQGSRITLRVPLQLVA